MEIWLIDSKELLLYRVLKDNKEQVIPIKDNKDMEKFIVIDKKEYLNYLIEEIEAK